MDAELAARLTALPRLKAGQPKLLTRPCEICRTPARFFDVTDYWKGGAFYAFGPSGIPVTYYRCDACGLMFTPLCDGWTDDEYRRYIYNDEYLAVDGEYSAIRPRRLATNMVKFLAGFEDARLVDFGSGAGLFAEHLREDGFKHVTSFDPFSQPMRPAGRFDIVTCFEVIEHSPDPLKTFQEIVSLLNDDGCVILGVSLQPPDIEVIRCNWSYCMPRNGHISLYTDHSLALLARASGLLLHPGIGIHLFTPSIAGRFAELARRVSLPLHPVSLNAPPSTNDPHTSETRWQSVELFSGVPARWTALTNVSWRVEIPQIGPVIARIRVPFLNEVRPGFAAESQLLVDGVEVLTTMTGRSICAEIRVEDRASIDVTLRTPPVVAPSELRGSSDRRRLGLAIICSGLE